MHSDLPVVTEERSDDEMRGACARGDEKEDAAAGRAYSCDHCHCSVCKRSLEHHDCQLSPRSTSSEHEVLSDDTGGSVAPLHHCTSLLVSVVNCFLSCCCDFQSYYVL